MNYSISGVISNGISKSAAPTIRPELSFRNFPNAWFNVNATGRIEGYVFNRVGSTNVPVERRLFLIRDEDALRMRMKFSDPATGFYRFDHLEMGYTYTVIAHDLYQTLNAVIKDKITPVPMP